MKSENEEWEKLCKLVANESNPQKLLEHLDRLIRALDARKRALRDERVKNKSKNRSTGDEW
jgi:hypothetical protein